MENQQLIDPFGRKIDYLRISITDRCNQRCIYCMPNGYHGWSARNDHLAANDIIRIVNQAAKLGIRKVRITGGEPTIRKDLVEIISGIHQIPEIKSIGLSTNGSRLEYLAAQLHNAGLRTINISLDALDNQLYHKITGGDLNEVLRGIRTAISAGFEMIKLNCVLMKDVNENQIIPLIQFASEHGLPLRLIELMLITSANFTNEKFLSIFDAMKIISQHDELISIEEHNFGWGPSKYYRLKTKRRDRWIYRGDDASSFLRNLQ
ncbi:MAG: GTP 3',8-cyclase MoaA [Verrucomicrobiia bacterium]